jgi:hypothetical protein
MPLLSPFSTEANNVQLKFQMQLLELPGNDISHEYSSLEFYESLLKGEFPTVGGFS